MAFSVIDAIRSLPAIVTKQQGGRHAKQREPSALARFVRALPGVRLGAPRAEPSGGTRPSESASDWLRSIAAAVNQTEFLQEAIDADDLPAAQAALRDGADPGSWVLHLNAASPEMRELVRVAQRVHALYPDSAPADLEKASGLARTPLDRLVQAYDTQAVRAELGRMDTDVSRLWCRARAAGREDIMRALLAVVPDSVTHAMARTPASEAVLSNAGLPKDWTADVLHVGIERGAYSRELTNYLSAIPGLDAGVLNYINGQDEVWCRHWASAWLEQAAAARNTGEPLDYQPFQTSNAILGEYAVDDLELRYDALRQAATETHIVDGERFGAFISSRLRTVPDGQSVHFLMCSASHAMALEITRQGRGSGAEYEVKFYDPNMTSTHTEARAFDHDTMADWTIGDFLHISTDPNTYFNKQESVVMLYALPESGMPTAIPAPIPDRRLTTSTIGDPLRSPTAVWHLFEAGCSGELSRLPEVVAQSDPEAAFALLSVNPAYSSGLSINSPLIRCMQSMDWDGKALFVEAFHACSGPVQQRLLEALIHELHGLVRDDQVKAPIAEFADFLRKDLQWPAEGVADFLRLTTEDDAPALYWSLVDDHATNVHCVGLAMADLNLPAPYWMAVLNAQRHTVPGFGMAMAHGSAAAVRTFGQVLNASPLSPAEREHLLLAHQPNSQGDMFGLLAAFRNNQGESIRAYGDALAESLTPEHAAHVLTLALSAQHPNGDFQIGGQWSSLQFSQARDATVEMLSRFPFNAQQASWINAAVGHDLVRVATQPAARPVIPRQMQSVG